MPRSDLCDFSDGYIVVKGNITVTWPDNEKRNKNVAFKKNASFINWCAKWQKLVVCKLTTQKT